MLTAAAQGAGGPQEASWSTSVVEELSCIRIVVSLARAVFLVLV